MWSALFQEALARECKRNKANLQPCDRKGMVWINLCSGPEQAAHPLWTSVFPAHSCCLDHHIQQLCGCRVCCAALAASVGHLTPFRPTQIQSWQKLAVQSTFLSSLSHPEFKISGCYVQRCAFSGNQPCLPMGNTPFAGSRAPLFFGHPFGEALGVAVHVGGCLWVSCKRMSALPDLAQLNVNQDTVGEAWLQTKAKPTALFVLVEMQAKANREDL